MNDGTNRNRARATTLARLIALIVVGAVAVTAPVAAQDYVGYAVTKEGEFALPEQVDDIEDKHFIQVRWGDYVGPRRVVAVLPVDNTSQASSYVMNVPGMGSINMAGYDYGGGMVPVNGIEAMITDCMQRTGRFRLVERVAMQDVLSEQNLASDGRTTKESGAKIGQVLGADILVQAVITSYEPDYKGKKSGLGAFASSLAGGMGRKKTSSLVGMNFRLIDSETSEIVFTQQIDVIITSKEWNFNAGAFGGMGGFSGFMSSYSNTPIGQAVMAGVNQGVLELVKEIGAEPMEGSVVRVSGDQIYVNLGEGMVEPGEVLNAISEGEELIDPDTGMSLGGESTTLGQIQVGTVNEKFSISRPLDFDSSQLSRGDPVISTKAPPPLTFAPRWAGPLTKEQKKKNKG